MPDDPTLSELCRGTTRPDEDIHCPDCGADGELAGHMECQYPQDHDDDDNRIDGAPEFFQDWF